MEYLHAFLLSTSPAGVWIALILVFIFAAVMSFILSYHWRNFGFHKTMIPRTTKIYFTGSTVLALGAAVSAIIFTFS